MKIFTWLGIFLLTGMLLLSFGCGSDDEAEKPNDNNITGPAAEPPPLSNIQDQAEPTFGGDTFGKPGTGDQLQRKPGEWGDPVPGLNFPIIYFAYDQSRISAGEQPKIERVVDYMKKYPSIGVSVQGHCDERGSEEYNRGLGERRAIAVKDYMIQLGIPENRLRTISYGEERPAMPGKTPQALQKNRRAELVPHRM